MDAIACEPQFLDHLAPVWRMAPPSVRGIFLVDSFLILRAAIHDLTVAPVDAGALRQMPQVQGGSDRPMLAASIGDIKVARRLGYGPFAFLEHGAGQSYASKSAAMASYAGGPDRADNELFLCPNQYSADLWRRAYPSARVEVVGSPRLDDLPRRAPGDGPVVAVSFHGPWPGGVAFGGNAWTDFHRALPELAKRFRVIGHGHPGKGWAGMLARQYERLGIPFVADFDDVCRQADVYVCDNSSTIFEFASTGRPVVLMNAAHWNRGPGPGLRFWDAAHVGVNVWPRDDLIAAVERALEHRPEDIAAREDALEFVYAYRYGGAERAVAVLEDWVLSRERVAA